MIGPSLSKLRRDWREGGAALLPPGMIARAVVWRMLARMQPGEAVRIVREERGFRVTAQPPQSEPTRVSGTARTAADRGTASR